MLRGDWDVLYFGWPQAFFLQGACDILDEVLVLRPVPVYALHPVNDGDHCRYILRICEGTSEHYRFWRWFRDIHHDNHNIGNRDIPDESGNKIMRIICQIHIFGAHEGHELGVF